MSMVLQVLRLRIQLPDASAKLANILMQQLDILLGVLGRIAESLGIGPRGGPRDRGTPHVASRALSPRLVADIGVGHTRCWPQPALKANFFSVPSNLGPQHGSFFLDFIYLG